MTMEAMNPAFLRTAKPFLQQRGDSDAAADGGGSDKTKHTGVNAGDNDSRSAKAPSQMPAMKGSYAPHGTATTTSSSKIAPEFAALQNDPNLVYPSKPSSGDDDDGDGGGSTSGRRKPYGGWNDDFFSRMQGAALDGEGGDADDTALQPEDEDVGYIEIESVALDGTRSVRRTRRPADSDPSAGGLEPVFLNPLVAEEAFADLLPNAAPDDGDGGDDGDDGGGDGVSRD